MKLAVKYAINPIDKPSEILDFLNGMGNWMINESEKWLQAYNPKKLSNMEIQKIHNALVEQEIITCQKRKMFIQKWKL